jgi:hypothetical protein
LWNWSGTYPMGRRSPQAKIIDEPVRRSTSNEARNLYRLGDAT